MGIITLEEGCHIETEELKIFNTFTKEPSVTTYMLPLSHIVNPINFTIIKPAHMQEPTSSTPKIMDEDELSDTLVPEYTTPAIKTTKDEKSTIKIITIMVIAVLLGFCIILAGVVLFKYFTDQEEQETIKISDTTPDVEAAADVEPKQTKV